MALSSAVENIRSNYRFHLSVRGGRLRRLAYLTLYFSIFAVFRWGDRHGRCLAWLKALGLSDLPVDVETPEGVRLRLDLHTAFDPLYSIFGVRDYDRFEALRLTPGKVVIDTGANVGVYTTLSATHVGESGRVVSVEPHPANFALLKANVERNGLRNVSLVQAAADDHEGEGELFVHERCINHSLVRRSGTSVPVRLRTLDSIARELGLERVDILKIDTEGNVPAILRGSRGLLRSHRPYVVFERDTARESAGLAEVFREAGYLSRDAGAFTYAWPSERSAAA